ncbi:hypothetical protein COOONC_24965, partial [Cooperia oncophora]
LIYFQAQDFAALLGPLLGGGGGGGGGIGSILSGLGGGGGGGKGPDIGSLLQLGAGLLNRNGGGGGSPFPMPAPAPAPGPGPSIGGPSNIAVPDYTDYGENVSEKTEITEKPKEDKTK